MPTSPPAYSTQFCFTFSFCSAAPSRYAQLFSEEHECQFEGRIGALLTDNTGQLKEENSHTHHPIYAAVATFLDFLKPEENS